LKVQQEAEKKVNELILEVFHQSNGTYGSPRVAQLLNQQEYVCSKTTVARRMKALNVKARAKTKFKCTTDSNHNYPIKPNLLKRNFYTDELAMVWVSDITYIWVKTKWMYLTTVIDLADRMVVGWSLSNDLTAEQTVIAAFHQAITFRMPEPEFIFHSDRGVQYACNEFTKLLNLFDCRQSMSRKGNCWDNAVAESFFKTIKVECIYRSTIASEQQTRKLIFNYIDGWYNTKRIHSSIGGISPFSRAQQLLINSPKKIMYN